MAINRMRWAAVCAMVIWGNCSIPSIALAGNGIVGFGPPPDESLLTNVTGVSGDGAVAVGGAGNAPASAFRWTSSSGITLITQRGDAVSDVAWGTNIDGSVIVGADSAKTGVGTPFRWTAATGVVSLGTLSGYAAGGEARAVNGDGSIVVGVSNAGVSPQAFRWTADSGMVGLNASTGSPANSHAYAISRNGQYIVGAASGLTGTHGPFRWTEASGMVPLAGPTGFFEGEARGVSADGNVIVGTTTIAGNGVPQAIYAFRWTAATGMVSLGELPGGTTYSRGNAISDDGNVIVGDSNSSYGSDTFYYTPTGGMRRLWDVLVAAGVNPAASGWTALNTATGVSADGLTVVGYGVHDGRIEGYAVTIPEPTSVGAITLVAATLLRRRRH